MIRLTGDIWKWLKTFKYLFKERENILNKRFFLIFTAKILYTQLFFCGRECFFVRRSAVYVVRSIKRYWISDDNHIFCWTSDRIFGEQVIIFLIFFNSFDHIFYKESFPNSSSETIAQFFANNLINDGVHYSLFLQNIIDGADKSNSNYRFIGFWYSGEMCALLFLLTGSTY